MYFLCCHLLVGAACLYYGFNPTRALVWLSTVSTVSVGGKHKQAIFDVICSKLSSLLDSSCG